jgi:predicted ATPase
VAALASLPATQPTIPEVLQTLVKKELLRRDSGLPGADDTYRFRHTLIHDSAYRALSKEARAQLHERYADWAEHSAGVDSGQTDETLAHHLKAAHDLRVELGHSQAAIAPLRLRAGERLAAAGLRAARRGDTPAAALVLLPAEHELRRQAQFQLAESLREAWLLADNPSENERHRLLATYRATIEAARALGERGIELLAELGQRELVWFNDLRTLLEAQNQVGGNSGVRVAQGRPGARASLACPGIHPGRCRSVDTCVAGGQAHHPARQPAAGCAAGGPRPAVALLHP